MHTVIRYIATAEGFAVVITGRADAAIAAVVQTYEAHTKHPILMEQWDFANDERDAVKFWEDKFVDLIDMDTVEYRGSDYGDDDIVDSAMQDPESER